MARRTEISTGLLPIWRRTVEAGETLPSEEALATALGTSRLAVREALIEMEANGLVRRHHGSGTYPNPAALEMPIRLDQHADFSDRLSAVGFAARVEVLSAEVTTMGTVGADTRLDLPETIPVLRTVKRWWADEVVAVVAIDVIPLARTTDAGEVVGNASEPLLELTSRYGIARADWMCTWPTAVELDASTAALLDYPAGRAVLRTEQLGIERHGRTVFHAREHHRPELVEHGLIRTVYH